MNDCTCQVMPDVDNINTDHISCFGINQVFDGIFIYKKYANILTNKIIGSNVNSKISKKKNFGKNILA